MCFESGWNLSAIMFSVFYLRVFHFSPGPVSILLRPCPGVSRLLWREIATTGFPQWQHPTRWKFNWCPPSDPLYFDVWMYGLERTAEDGEGAKTGQLLTFNVQLWFPPCWWCLSLLIFFVLFSDLSSFCAKQFCSNKTILWATEWTRLFRRRVTLAVFHQWGWGVAP